MTHDRTVGVDVDIACDDEVPSTDFVSDWVDRAVVASQGGIAATEVSVRIVDADEIRTLNRDYRQRDYATNVLSFPAGDIKGLPDDAVRALGDIVICASVVAAEAAEHGKTLQDRWAHMLVHGSLHLLGYDHETDDAAQAMESLEARILAEGGVGDPYE